MEPEQPKSSSQDDEPEIESAELSDVPAGLKRITAWCYRFLTDRPEWQRGVIGTSTFLGGIYFGSQIAAAINVVAGLLAQTVGTVSFTINHVILVVVGVIAGLQWRVSRQLNMVGDEVEDMTPRSPQTDGGREIELRDSDDGGDATGGGAIGGAIAGGAIGAAFGPGGAIGGAVLGAILGDGIEKNEDKQQRDNKGQFK
ncbi:hypothetical protein [Natrinema versiforme]|uniref:hypothetical protein n=1 Tax=Natrinema versiforme TaxID=88724 RepID=UPI0015862270|nr:hypothetical protein [Natrinema versiforme]